MTKPRTVPQDGARSRPDPAGGGSILRAVRRGRDAENATTEGKMISTYWLFLIPVAVPVQGEILP